MKNWLDVPTCYNAQVELMNNQKRTLDIEKLLDSDDGPNSKEINQNHHLDIGFDLNYLYKDAKQSIEDGKLFKGNYVINNEQRDVGVITGSYITQCHGIKGLPEGTIVAKTHGHLDKV